MQIQREWMCGPRPPFGNRRRESKVQPGQDLTLTYDSYINWHDHIPKRADRSNSAPAPELLMRMSHLTGDVTSSLTGIEKRAMSELRRLQIQYLSSVLEVLGKH